MHAGKNFTFQEVIFWTRKDIYLHLLVAAVPTSLYILLDWTWLGLPWLPIALLGTSVAFLVSFKNNASYDRLWEARKIWGAILNGSRIWGIMVKDYVTAKHATSPISQKELHEVHRQLFYRHFAWLTALRYQLREPRAWEAIYKPHNQEYKNKWFRVEEQDGKVEDALRSMMTEEEFKLIITKSNKPRRL